MSRSFGSLNRWAAMLAGLALGLVFAAQAGEQKPAEAPKTSADDKPITTAGGELGDLLRKWYKEGTAAGNKGDLYDNRDRKHSELDLKPYPQLQKRQYSEEERQRGLDWALFAGLRPGVVFGNSSTASGPYQGGSNPRHAYLNPLGLEVLYRQYRGNNLYIYPAHHDHWPGHNGVPEFFGDLYPTNTPYVLISQGSSGSDQPFMRAVPFTLAAFRPEVKKKLAESGLLMPTIQMLLRFTSKRLADPAKEYLTGLAHPSVFEGQWVNDLKMVQMAHEISLEDIPPLALLKVQDEDAPADGLDFFEPGASEKFADTPVVIARHFRGRHYIHRMTVSAESSLDVNKRPLAWHWAVLRGDASRIKMVPKNETGSVAELLVPYHERRPVLEGSALESNRVDIGVFVHNGKYYSPPSFVTFFFLDHEARCYDEQGRILEIGYKMGQTTLSVNDWSAFFALLSSTGVPPVVQGQDAPATSWPARLLRKQFQADQLAGLLKAAEAYKAVANALASAQGKQKSGEAAKNKTAADLKTVREKRDMAEAASQRTPGAETKAAFEKAEADYTAATESAKKVGEGAKSAQKTLETAQKAAKDFLGQKREGLGDSIQALADRALYSLAKDPNFYCGNQAEIEALLASPEGQKRKGALANARGQLAGLGILKGQEGQPFELCLIRPLPPTPSRGGEGAGGGAAAAERATPFEKGMLERFHGEMLSSVLYPGIIRSDFRVNYVPPEISEPPAWRDVYHYDAKGHDIGWRRYGSGAPVDFTSDGLKVLERDPKGRPLKAQTVKYEPEKPTEAQVKRLSWPFWRQTLQLPGNEVRYYAYDGDDDWKGKVLRTERLEEKKSEETKPEKGGGQK